MHAPQPQAPHRTARDIFLEAVEQHQPERWPEFLHEACRGDLPLQRRVERLLEAHREAPEPTGIIPDSDPPAATRDMPPAAEPPGTQIGPYKLREQIGEGGFGVVYVAEQEKPVARKVALKIIKPGMDTREVIARFEAERQALALMDHPNIAKVLDAGTTSEVGDRRSEVGKEESSIAGPTSALRPPTSGRPYFVMELVRGVPITEFCDDHKLNTRERLQLFIDVCRAVQHAHQKGIIHRDLKPSNVMVTLHDDKPVVKVIDFGISKALSQKLTEKTIYTAYGQMVGTPLYMSPEQAQLTALDVDTRSDVYSLGVLLYELLTGSTPFDKETLQKSGFDEMRRIIREVEPPRPSARISTLNAELLSTVSGKRHIDPRRLSQLLRGELDWIVMKALEKDRNRRYESANAFAADAERFLNDEPVQACPPSAGYRLRKFARRKKGTLTAAGLLLLAVTVAGSGIGWAVRDGVAREQEAARDRESRQTRLAAQVELILDEVERLQSEQKWPEALATAKRAETALESGDADAETQQRVRQVVVDLELVRRLEDARLLEGQTSDVSFDRAGAERAYSRAFADAGLTIEGVTVERAAGPLRARSRIVTELAMGLTDWARLRKITTKGTQDTGWKHLLAVADAIDHDAWCRRLRAMYKAGDQAGAKALRELADSADVRILPPSSIEILARLLRSRVSPEESAKLLLRAQKHRPGDFWISFNLAFSLHASTPKRLEEALVFYHAALALRPAHPGVVNNLGNVLRDEKKLDEAIACYRKAIELDPKMAMAHNGLGVVLSDQKKLDEAIACYREAIELDPKFAAAYSNLGNALRDQKKLDEAIACYRKAIELDPKYASAHNNLGFALRKQGKLDEAIACYRKALEFDPKHANAHNGLGVALRDQGKLEEAIAACRKALEFDPKHAGAYNSLGNALKDQGKLREAIASYRKAIKIDPKCAMAHSNLGAALRKQGKRDEAILCYRKAIELDPMFALAHNNLGVARMDQGKLDKAIACYRKAIQLDPMLALAHDNLGNALRQQGKLREAIAACRKAIELDPKFASAHGNLGRALKDQGKLDEAVACYRKAIELDPKDAYARNNLGRALYRQKKLDEAFACFRKAIELDPKNVSAHISLGVVYYEQNKLDEAIACYRKAIELDPKFAAAHNNLGNALYNQKKLDEAIACCHKAIQLDPKDAAAHNNLGNALYNQKKLDEAIACYHKAIQLDPKDAAYHANLGNALKDQGKVQDAIACYRKAIELDPKDARAHNLLGVALTAQGKLDEAIACFRKAVPLVPQDYPLRRNLAITLWQRGRSADRAKAITHYRKAIELMPYDDAATLNNFAWQLATFPDARFRDPVAAVAAAGRAVKLAPKNGNWWNTLGVAHYRNGDWKAALTALRKSTQLRANGGDAHDWFFLAMAEWQLGNQRQARTWYERGVRWMEQNQRQNLELRRFRTEAEALLGIQPPVEARRPLAARNQRRRPVSARRPKNHSLRITDN